MIRLKQICELLFYLQQKTQLKVYMQSAILHLQNFTQKTMFHLLRGIISNLRYYRTACLFLGYIVIGQSYGIVGPTLVHMEHVLNTNTQGMAMSFSGDNIGAFIGALLCGLLFDQFSCELQFSYGFISIAILTSLAPWMPNVYLFCVTMTARSIVLGYINSAGKPYMLKLWLGQKYKDAMFQASQASWSLGAFTIPLLVIPFLCNLPSQHNKTLTSNSGGEHSVINKHHLHLGASRELMQIKSNVAEIIESNYPVEDEDLITPRGNEYLKVRYAYCIIGVFATLASVLFYRATKQVDISQNGGSIREQELARLTTAQSTVTETQHSESDLRADRFETVLTALIFIYTSFTVWQGTILGTFLSAFVIKELDWSVEKGPLITSVFRGVQGLGRVMGIPLSMYLFPGKILLLSMILAFSAYSVMLSAVIVFQSESLVWLSTAMAGLALSNSYSTTVLWGAQYLRIKASYGSLFVAAASFGGMTSGFLAGHLFQHHRPHSVIYIILFAVMLNMVLFCVMNVTVKFYEHYKNNNASKDTLRNIILRKSHYIKTI